MNEARNHVQLIGNLGDDPTLFGDGDSAGARFDIAVNESFGRGKERRKQTNWFTVVCWNGLVKSAQRLAKGDQVAVFGKLRAHTWTGDDGKSRKDVEVHAGDVVFLKVKSLRAADPAKSAGTPPASAEDEDDIPF